MAKEKWDRNREKIQELVQQGKMIFEGAFLNLCDKVFSRHLQNIHAMINSMKKEELSRENTLKFKKKNLPRKKFTPLCLC